MFKRLCSWLTAVLRWRWLWVAVSAYLTGIVLTSAYTGTVSSVTLAALCVLALLLAWEYAGFRRDIAVCLGTIDVYQDTVRLQRDLIDQQREQIDELAHALSHEQEGVDEPSS